MGDRAYHLRRAVHAIGAVVRVVRVSAIRETDAVDAPQGSPPFLNLVLIGTTELAPFALLTELLAIETRLGRRRRGVRNEPRIIDIDLILHGATRMRTPELTLPHPRAHEREFVMGPLREIGVIGVLASALTYRESRALAVRELTAYPSPRRSPPPPVRAARRRRG